MLKVERKNSRSPAVIKLRERARFLSPLLVRSLLIAFAIHFISYHLFIIKKEDSTSSFLFPSVEVQGEGVSPADSLTIVAARQFTSGEIIIIPSFVDYSESDHLVKTSTDREELTFTDPFSTFEERLFPPTLSFPQQPTPLPKIEVSVSGALAHRHYTYEFELSDADEALLKNIDNPLQIPYDIQIDPVTGKIIWYVLKNNTIKTDLKRLSEKLLNNITFNKNNEFNYTTGQINVFIFK